MSQRDKSSERERGQRHQLHRGALRTLPRPASSFPPSGPAGAYAFPSDNATRIRTCCAPVIRAKGRDTERRAQGSGTGTAVLPRGFLTSRGGREGSWLVGWLANKQAGRQGVRWQGVHIHRFAQMQLPWRGASRTGPVHPSRKNYTPRRQAPGPHLLPPFQYPRRTRRRQPAGPKHTSLCTR